jgi:hypothetical protein
LEGILRDGAWGVTVYFWWIGSHLTRQKGFGGLNRTVHLQKNPSNHIWRVSPTNIRIKFTRQGAFGGLFRLTASQTRTCH